MMKPVFAHSGKRAGVVVAFLFLLATMIRVASESRAVPPHFDGWLEQLTGFAMVHQGRAQSNGETAGFDLYLEQLGVVRRFYEAGDFEQTFAAMNRFMDMLEARTGGISSEAADAIWDYCYQVTPPSLHDVKRHRQWWDKTVDWERFFWEE
jgi:hypothetical protein